MNGPVGRRPLTSAPRVLPPRGPDPWWETTQQRSHDREVRKAARWYARVQRRRAWWASIKERLGVD